MTMPMSERTMVLMGQVFMIVLAAVLAVAPHLYMIAVILYFALIMGLSMYMARRRAAGGVPREEVLKARTLLKEDKAFELALADEEYVQAMSRQAKAMLYPLLLFPLYIIIFRAAYVLQRPAEAAFASIGVVDKRVAAFFVWLLVFEAMFALNLVVRKLTSGKGSVMAPFVPAGYRVTSKGIVLKGGFGQVIGFPLPKGSKVRLNAERNYVEIEMPKSGKIRLYSKKAKRLYEIISRYGLPEEKKEA